MRSWFVLQTNVKTLSLISLDDGKMNVSDGQKVFTVFGTGNVSAS